MSMGFYSKGPEGLNNDLSKDIETGKTMEKNDSKEVLDARGKKLRGKADEDSEALTKEKNEVNIRAKSLSEQAATKEKIINKTQANASMENDLQDLAPGGVFLKDKKADTSNIEQRTAKVLNAKKATVQENPDQQKGAA